MLSFFQPSFTPFERRVFGDDFFTPHFQTRRHFHTRPASYRRRPVDPFASFDSMINQALMDTLSFTAPAAPVILARPSPPPPVVTVKVITQKPRRQLKRRATAPQHPKKSSSAPTILPSPQDPPKAIESAETIPVQQNEQPQPVVNNQQVVSSSSSPSATVAPQAKPLDLLSVPSMFRPFFSSPFWPATNQDEDEADQLWHHHGVTLERKENNDVAHEWLAKTPVDLPAGWTPENLEVSLENGGRFLSVRGSLTTNQEALRSSRRFARQIRLPEGGVDPETAQARLTKDEKTGQFWVEISMRPQTPPSTSTSSSSSSSSGLTVEQQKNESKIIPVQCISSSSSSSSSSVAAAVESDSSSSGSEVESEVKEADSTPPEETCSSSCDSCSSSSSSCGVCDVQEDGGCCSSASVEQKEDAEMETPNAPVQADLEMDLKVETEDVEEVHSNNNNNNVSIAQESQEETDVTPEGPAEEEEKAVEAGESTTQVTPAEAAVEEEMELPMPDEE